MYCTSHQLRATRPEYYSYFTTCNLVALLHVPSRSPSGSATRSLATSKVILILGSCAMPQDVPRAPVVPLSTHRPSECEHAVSPPESLSRSSHIQRMFATNGIEHLSPRLSASGCQLQRCSMVLGRLRGLLTSPRSLVCNDSSRWCEENDEEVEPTSLWRAPFTVELLTIY